MKTKTSKTQSSHTKTSIDKEEVAKFNRLAAFWWDMEGPLKTLHDINPCRLSFIQQYIDLNDCSVLDVGCGGGILAESMAKSKAQVTGLDADPESVSVAKNHAEAQSLPIHYTASTIESFTGGPFQAITCMEMLEHVPHPEAIIAECARLLQPGGLLFLSTLNRSVKSYVTAVLAAEYLLNILPRQTHDYQRFIKPSELAAMVRGAGLELIDVKGIAYNPFTREASLDDSVAVNYLMVCQSKVDRQT